MIFDNIVKDKISKLKKIVLFNNFPEDIQNSIINSSLEFIKTKYGNNFEIQRIYEDINIKKLTQLIQDINLFSEPSILIIYNLTQNFNQLKKLNIPEDVYLFIFINEKSIDEDKEICLINFPKNLDSTIFIDDFCKKNKIEFENREVEDLFKSYFINISSSLEKVMEDILLFLSKIKSNIITKEIAVQFLTYSSNYSFFTILNSFFQKDKYTFFYQYIQFVESENDFNSFFQPFLKEIKLLTTICSLFEGKLSISSYDKNEVISFFNKIEMQYNPYRFQYDLKKIENFGKEKFFLLLEFLLSIDIYNRYYDKFSAQKLFEIGINQFI